MVQRESSDGSYSFWWNGELKGQASPINKSIPTNKAVNFNIGYTKTSHQKVNGRKKAGTIGARSTALSMTTTHLISTALSLRMVFMNTGGTAAKLTSTTFSSTWVDGPSDARYQPSGKKTNAEQSACQPRHSKTYSRSNDRTATASVPSVMALKRAKMAH